MSEPRQHKAFVSFSVSLLWAGPNNARNQQRDGFTQAGGVLASSQVQNEEQTLPEGLSTSATPAPRLQPFRPGEAAAGSSAALAVKALRHCFDRCRHSSRILLPAEDAPSALLGKAGLTHSCHITRRSLVTPVPPLPTRETQEPPTVCSDETPVSGVPAACSAGQRGRGWGQVLQGGKEMPPGLLRRSFGHGTQTTSPLLRDCCCPHK